MGVQVSCVLSRCTQCAYKPTVVRWLLITAVYLFLGTLLVIPLIVVFGQALSAGLAAYGRAISHPDTRAALALTLLVAAICVPLNTVFGLAAAWLIARFQFLGKRLLTTLVDLPFAISPVITGLLFVLVLGANSWVGSWLALRGIKVIFAVPGIVITTMFVTLPFVARELIPSLQARGQEEEEAALVLGATGWQMLRRITLPNVKWSLFYGVILCNARAMGEFGAVSVVSGHIRGATTTLPLHVEMLYNEYNFAASFAVASLLMVLALITMVVKRIAERHSPERSMHSGFIQG